MVHIYSGWDHFPVVALAERGMMGIFRRRVWEYFESFLWSEKQERGEWVRMLWLVNRGDAGQQHVMLRILFQVCCCWRLFPGVLAAEEECEWQPGAGTEQQPAPVPGACGEPRSAFRVRGSELAGTQGSAWDAEPLQPPCCTSPTVLLTSSNSLLFRVRLWNVPWWIQISKTCWKVSQLESFAGNAFSELCSGNGLSGSFSFLFFSVFLLKNSASNVLYTEGSGATATEQRWIDVVQENL